MTSALSPAAQKTIKELGFEEARAAARALLWRNGDLSWALHDDQLRARDQLREAEARGERRFVFMCGRRWGKTRFFVVDAFEFALANPGTIIPYAALTLESAEQFVMPEARYLAAWAPPEDRPTILEGIVRFKNGSEIIIAGTETEVSANRLRGRPAKRAYADEAGFNPILVYLIESVLTWTMVTTDGTLLMGSSAPLTPAHAFAQRYVPTAAAQGTLVRRTTRDAPHIKPEVLDKMCREMGGPDSVEWRREGMCELLTDERRAVIPEFTAHRTIVAPAVWPEPPSHRHWYVAADLGYSDGSASLLGWHDFMHHRLMIEDERILTRPTSTDVQNATADMDRRHIPQGQRVRSRVADAALITIADMAKLQPTIEEPARWRATAKDDLEGAVNAVRVRIARHEILIHPRCTVLLSHIEFAIWNVRRTEFERLSEEEAKTFAKVAGAVGLRHFDALAALIYLVRSINWLLNPFPAGPMPSRTDQHVPAHLRTRKPKRITNRKARR